MKVEDFLLGKLRIFIGQVEDFSANQSGATNGV